MYARSTASGNNAPHACDNKMDADRWLEAERHLIELDIWDAPGRPPQKRGRKRHHG